MITLKAEGRLPVEGLWALRAVLRLGRGTSQTGEELAAPHSFSCVVVRWCWLHYYLRDCTFKCCASFCRYVRCHTHAQMIKGQKNNQGHRKGSWKIRFWQCSWPPPKRGKNGRNWEISWKVRKKGRELSLQLEDVMQIAFPPNNP